MIPANFSNASPITDIAAPGVNIRVASYTDRDTFIYDSDDGTSFSAPITAASALLLHQMFPENSMEEIGALLTAITPYEIEFNGFSLPELNFSQINEYVLSAPEPISHEEGNSTLIIDCEADVKADGFRAEMIGPDDQVISSVEQFSSYDLVFSDLPNETAYSVRLYKFIEAGGIHYYSPAAEIEDLVPTSSPGPIKPRAVLHYNWNAPDGTDMSGWTLPEDENVLLRNGEGIAVLRQPGTFGVGNQLLLGWAGTDDADAEPLSDQLITLTGDTTLYGVWEEHAPDTVLTLTGTHRTDQSSAEQIRNTAVNGRDQRPSARSFSPLTPSLYPDIIR